MLRNRGRLVKFGVVVFPGSNCDHDAYHALKHVVGQETQFLWHKDRDLRGVEAVVVPGGFSYGDYLRSGAIAKFSPIMESVRHHAARGGLVLGICNGFQILQESGLLPGAMLPNSGLKFVCQYVYLRTENNTIPFTRACRPGQVLKIPIAHHDGNFFADDQMLDSLHEHGQVVFRYCDTRGRLDDRCNPNGSLDAIAGVCNRQGNVMGLMPHPERASEGLLGSNDGLLLFQSMVQSLQLAGQ